MEKVKNFFSSSFDGKEGKQLTFCPKYLCILIIFAILKNYENNPKFMNWKWWVIIGGIVLSTLSTLYNMYEVGFKFSIITNILWLILYGLILYLYAIPFSKKEEVDDRVKKLGFAGHAIMTFTWIIMVFAIIMVILCITQFIPIVDIVTIPIVRVLSIIF